MGLLKINDDTDKLNVFKNKRKTTVVMSTVIVLSEVVIPANLAIRNIRYHIRHENSRNGNTRTHARTHTLVSISI